MTHNDCGIFLRPRVPYPPSPAAPWESALSIFPVPGPPLPPPHPTPLVNTGSMGGGSARQLGPACSLFSRRWLDPLPSPKAVKQIPGNDLWALNLTKLDGWKLIFDDTKGDWEGDGQAGPSGSPYWANRRMGVRWRARPASPPPLIIPLPITPLLYPSFFCKSPMTLTPPPLLQPPPLWPDQLTDS